MAEDREKYSLPFVTRDMLAFEHATIFGLRIQSQSTAGGSLTIRGMTREGPFTFVHIPTSDSILGTENFRLPDLPIFVSVTDRDGVLVQGDTYVTLSLTVNGDILHQLSAGFVYRQRVLSWPNNNSADLRPGGGQLLQVTSANPAAGSEVTVTVPTGQIWRIYSMRAQLVTDATAATRRVIMALLDASSNVLWRTWPADDQTASLTRDYHFLPTVHANDSIEDINIHVPLPPDLLVPSGFTLVTQTTNFQAGDNWGLFRIMVDRYFTPA